MRCGRLYLTLPAGIDILTQNHADDALQPGRSGIALILTCPPLKHDAPLFSLKARDMTPAAFPVTIVLNITPPPSAAPLLVQARIAADELSHRLPDFNLHLLTTDRIVAQEAAKVHFSLTTRMRIEHLSLTWRIGREQASLLMLLTAADASALDPAWRLLHRLAASMRLIPAA